MITSYSLHQIFIISQTCSAHTRKSRGENVEGFVLRLNEMSHAQLLMVARGLVTRLLVERGPHLKSPRSSHPFWTSPFFYPSIDWWPDGCIFVVNTNKRLCPLPPCARLNAFAAGVRWVNTEAWRLKSRHYQLYGMFADQPPDQPQGEVAVGNP